MRHSNRSARKFVLQWTYFHKLFYSSLNCSILWSITIIFVFIDSLPQNVVTLFYSGDFHIIVCKPDKVVILCSDLEASCQQTNKSAFRYPSRDILKPRFISCPHCEWQNDLQKLASVFCLFFNMYMFLDLSTQLFLNWRHWLIWNKYVVYVCDNSGTRVYKYSATHLYTAVSRGVLEKRKVCVKKENLTFNLS